MSRQFEQEGDDDRRGSLDSQQGTVNWSVFSCSQNLSAILSDPKRGKQKDFFTKTWGEGFTEQAAVSSSALLPEVPNAYFAAYYKKLLKRNKKYRDRKSSGPGSNGIMANGGPQRQDGVHTLFPQLGLKDPSQLLKSEGNPIPKIFFSQSFSLKSSETFREVLSVGNSGLPSKFVQDKLSHYLDLVEVGLAQQISKKSSAFFSAVSTQDKVAEKVTRAIDIVRKIKGDIGEIKNENVVMPLTIIKQQRKKNNFMQLCQKLELMSTVHKAQRAIQSFLGNSDFVGALDLIATTQDVLHKELQGLVCFRHLDSQLVEIRSVIEKMLRAELERNLSADLNRPVEQVHAFCDKDRLISIICGHFRLGQIAPVVSVLAKEVGTAMTTTCKQTLIEAISESDSKSDSLINSNSMFQGIVHLPSELWIKLITQLGHRLILLVQHIKDVILLMQSCADMAVGRANTLGATATSLTDNEDPLMSESLHATFSSELCQQLLKTTENADEKFTGMLRFRKTYLIRSEVLPTLEVVKKFIFELEEFAHSLNPEESKTYRFKCALEMKLQIAEFVKNFHLKQIESINAALDREKWKVISEEKLKKNWPDVHIRRMIDKKRESASDLEDGLTTTKNNKDINVNYVNVAGDATVINGCQESEPVLTAEVFYILLDAVAEYCQLYMSTGTAEVVLGIVEILRVANTRINHLILGAGAVELKICKSITVNVLAVVLRGLRLLAEAITEMSSIFDQGLLPSKSQHVLKQVGMVQQEYYRHAESVENKMVSILEEVIDSELKVWEARPPVPSTPINNVSRNIARFKEAIGTILAEQQVFQLFIKIDKSFRTKLKQRIAELGIRKDGGPSQGVVTSEMMHYADNIRKLNILPENLLKNSCLTNDLWS